MSYICACHLAGDMDLATRAVIEQSLASGERVTSALAAAAKRGKKSTEEFAQTLGMVAGTASKFLSGIGSVVSLVLMFVPSEVQLLHNQLLDRFDRIDSTLQSLSDKMDDLSTENHFVNMKQKYETYVSEIRIFENKLVELGKSRSKDIKMSKMLTSREGKMPGRKLALQFTKDKIHEYYFNYTKGDRAATLAFIATGLDYIIAGAEVDIAYDKLNLSRIDYWTEQQKQNYIEDEIGFCVERIIGVENVMKKWDDWARSDYIVVRQAYSELEKYVEDSALLGLGTQGFVNAIRDKLDSKYFWRKWLVLSVMYEDDDKLHRLFGSEWFCFYGSDDYVWDKLYNPGNGDQRWLIVANYPKDIKSNCQADLDAFKQTYNALGWTKGGIRYDCEIDDRWIWCTDMVCDVKDRAKASLKQNGFAMAMHEAWRSPSDAKMKDYNYLDMHYATTPGTTLAKVTGLEKCSICPRSKEGNKMMAYAFC